MKTTVKITNDEIKQYLDVPAYEFPKYSTQILNLANQNAQATRPRVVGQMSELIQEFPHKTIKEWEEWYLEGHPEAIGAASEKLMEMVENLKDAMGKIDKELVTAWVRDLVIIKTFIGLRFQEAILKKAAESMSTGYRMSSPEDESKGIDGYINDVPVSIKPSSYKQKAALRENIVTAIVYYEKVKDGIVVDFEELFAGD